MLIEMPVNDAVVEPVKTVTKTAKKPSTTATKPKTGKPKNSLKNSAQIKPTPEQVNENMREKIVCLGIDPGARYTAVSLRDEEGTIYLSSTYYRDDDTDEIEWMHECVQYIENILKEYNADIIAVEKTVDPKGYGTEGKRDPLNPKDIVRTAIVVGGIAQRWKQAIPIRPRRNGSAPLEEYPDSIKGRRPSNLPGDVNPKVTTRKHERSAYDVAGHAFFEHRKNHSG